MKTCWSQLPLTVHRMSNEAVTVGAVIVTHNSQQWLPDLIASIDGQTRPVDSRVAIDDFSSDATVELLHEAGWTVKQATSSAVDVTTRIAQNFTQGLRTVGDVDFCVLGDHDDYWLPDRVDHQVRLLSDHPEAWMVASDGRIMNQTQTLRDTFPVPADWENLSRQRRIRYALRHSIATGGACAVRPRVLLDPSTLATPVPHGWLHDRWWSLAATAQDAIVLDGQPVIEYRVQEDQQVGLDRGRQLAGIFRPRTSDFLRAREALRLVKQV